MFGNRGRRACGWASCFLIMRDLIKWFLLLFKTLLFHFDLRGKKFFRETGKSVKPFEKLIPKIGMETRIWNRRCERGKTFSKGFTRFWRLYNRNGWSGLVCSHKTHECLWQADPNHPTAGFLNEIKTLNDSNRTKLFPFQWGKKNSSHSKRENFFPWAFQRQICFTYYSWKYFSQTRAEKVIQWRREGLNYSFLRTSSIRRTNPTAIISLKICGKFMIIAWNPFSKGVDNRFRGVETVFNGVTLRWQDAQLLQTELGNRRLSFLLVIRRNGASVIYAVQLNLLDNGRAETKRRVNWIRNGSRKCHTLDMVFTLNMKFFAWAGPCSCTSS